MRDSDGWGEADWFQDLKVFVYGTLMPGGFYWDRYCEGRVERWWKARIRGEIYHLPLGYPAARLGGPHWIYGVVLVLRDRRALEGIDELEGFSPKNPDDPSREYLRKRVEALGEGGEPPQQVWAYEMDLAKINGLGGVRIESGLWEEGRDGQS